MKLLVQSLKALADLTRLKIYKLVSRSELCVCELADIMEISQSAVSQHLNKLKQVGLVTERRSGQWIYYKADLEQAENLIQQLTILLSADVKSLPGMEIEAEKLRILEEGNAVVCSPERRENQ